MSRGFKLSVLLTVVAVLGGVAAAEAAPGKLANPNAGPAGIEWRPVATEMGLVLTVSGPQGFYLRQEYGPGRTASFSVFDSAGAVRPAGSYVYELRAVPQVDDATRAQLQAARESGTEPGVLGKAGRRAQEVQSGAFAIADGAILMGGESEPGAGKPAGGNRITTKDQVIPDDLIVQGSACIGIDCVNNESFGFDTIRMKENNTRIDFTDTSTSAGFPSQDWEIAANDSASGGRNALIVSDENTQLFVIESGNLANALYVDDLARVGLRTSNPVLDLHISTGNTPAIRLEQTNASGFTAQTWDIAGNEANFFVRDVTGGSLLPFRIRPGAPTSSVDISGDGDVGIGTGSPSVKLHVSGSNGSTSLRVEETNGTVASRTMAQLVNNGEARLNFLSTNTSSNWELISGTTFVVNRGGSGVNEMIINSGGNVTIAGLLTQNSDRTTKTDINPVDSEAVLAKVAELPIATWRKIGDTGTHLGPMAQDFAAAFGLGEDDRHIAAVDMAGVSLAAIQALHQELAARDAEIASLRAQLADEVTALKAAVEELQARQ